MLGTKTPLGRVRGLGSARSGTEHFWRQRVTAVANVPLVIAFLVIVVSLIGAEHGEAATLLAHPLVSVVMALVIVSICTHMRLGMQVIIEDYIHGELAKMAALMANSFYAAAVAVTALFALARLSLGG